MYVEERGLVLCMYTSIQIQSRDLGLTCSCVRSTVFPIVLCCVFVTRFLHDFQGKEWVMFVCLQV